MWLWLKNEIAREIPKNTLRASFSEESHVLVLLWGQKSNGNKGIFPSLHSHKVKFLPTCTKDNFMKWQWLIRHISFTLATLFKKLAVNIEFIIKPFSKKSVEYHSRKKNIILILSFQSAVIGYNFHCLGRNRFSKDAFFFLWINPKVRLTLRFVYLKARFWLVSLQ